MFLPAGLLLCTLMPLPAGADKPVFTFTEVTDADLQHIDLHDGCIDDWLEVLGEPVLLGRNAYRIAFPTAIRDYDPSDFDFRIWLAWHDATNRIYVAMESSDDDYTTAHGLQGSKVYWDSNVSVLVDGDRSGGAFYLWDYEGGIWDRDAAQLEVGSQQIYWARPETHDGDSRVDLSRSTHVPIDWPLYPPTATAGAGPLASIPSSPCWSSWRGAQVRHGSVLLRGRVPRHTVRPPGHRQP